MFGKKKDNNTFGDKGYQMKENYQADELVIANLQVLSSNVTEFGPVVETTEQMYIFEVINGDNKKYREICTGFIAGSEVECFDLPYVVNTMPLTDLISDLKGETLPKLSLLWIQNDVNYQKPYEKAKK